MNLITYELPEGWCVSTINELCELNPKHDSSLKASLSVSFVPMAAVSEVEGIISKPEIRPLGEVKKGYTHFADGDVILAKITPCMENGKAASVRGMVNGLACGTTEFFVFRSRGGIDQDYLFKFIRQESFRRAARATMQSGVGQARVPKEFVLETEIPLAPLPEQRRIVAKIEALQARSRKCREALEAVLPLLEHFRQSVLAAAFRGDLTADWREQHPEVEPASVLLERIRAERRRQWEKAELAKFKANGKVPKDDSWKERYVEPVPVDDADLPELPEGWCWTSIDTLTMDSPQNGLYVPRTKYGAGTPILRIDDYQIDWCRASTELQQVDIDEATARIYQLRIGDIVVNRVNSPSHLGKSIVITKSSIPAVFESNMMRLELASHVGAYYCHFFLTSTLGKSLLTKNAKWAVNQASINQGDVVSTPIPLAPNDEQHAILNLIRKAQECGRRATTDVTESESKLTQLDQSILAKAFRGELVPQDPNDEPASVLLERIQAERAADTNGKPARGRRK